MKKMVNEFKEFIMRGNVMDMAVGVIIGGAFKGIVDSLVKDVIMPVITLVTGGINFEDWFIALDGKSYATLAEANAAAASTVNYGTFITGVLNFLIMAVIIFLLVKGLNKLANFHKKSEADESPAPKTKVCPFCKSEIPVDATRCAHCTSQLPEELNT